MPGSWEIQAANRVLLATLHTDVTSIAWALGFRNLIIPGPPPLMLAGMPYDHGRNQGCKIALEMGVEFLFFLDSDVIPPHDAILRLMAHNVPLISGLYCRRSPPHGVPVMIKNGQWVTSYPHGAVIEVDLVGAGCLLMRRDLLEQMPPLDERRGKKWFDWRVDCVGLKPGEALSEDFSMCQHVRKTMGVKVLVDCGVQCRHIGLAQASYGRFDPCEAASVT